MPPTLNYAQVQVLGPTGAVVATGANSQAGADVSLLDISLPTDGTYTINVQASPNQPGSTGDYVITAWNAPVNHYSLNLGQSVNGQLGTPYATDNWTFSAMANEQIKFNLLNASLPIRSRLRAPDCGLRLDGTQFLHHNAAPSADSRPDCLQTAFNLFLQTDNTMRVAGHAYSYPTNADRTIASAPRILPQPVAYACQPCEEASRSRLRIAF